ncbi:hypothetical protein HJC23_008708 [Cyclotella cryptica]|uniref:Uncharacterized protein n=1 Tax=Cyclotella cryptica TaxID=29204 RepID=A0ABD3PD47_9STRA|eukprot:CCRYP_005440-RB/>CCRYP_005440-RB protein AED:0.01 eAED:0.01 QI:285/-1/1/1/-1/1/1/648/285
MASLPKLLVAASLLSWFSLIHSFSPTRLAQVSRSTHPRMTPHRRVFPVLSKLKPNKSTNRTVLYAAPTANDSESLAPETIAEMIEVSFIQSCLQLASGYIDVLKLFIVSVKAGYEANLSFEVLSKLVEECPVNSAGRDLANEEKDLRSEWILVVYEMLNGLKVSEPMVEVINNNQCAKERVHQVVLSVLAIKKELESEDEQSGGKQDAIVAITSLSVDEAIRRSDLLTKLNDSCNTPIEQALLKNDIRVAILAIKVLEEEKLCSEGSSSSDFGGEVPRPPIPGTS